MTKEESKKIVIEIIAIEYDREYEFKDIAGKRRNRDRNPEAASGFAGEF